MRRSKQIAGVKVQTLTFLTQGCSQNFPKRGRRANLIVFVGWSSNNNKKEEKENKKMKAGGAGWVGGWVGGGLEGGKGGKGV